MRLAGVLRLCAVAAAGVVVAVGCGDGGGVDPDPAGQPGPVVEAIEQRLAALEQQTLPEVEGSESARPGREPDAAGTAQSDPGMQEDPGLPEPVGELGVGERLDDLELRLGALEDAFGELEGTVGALEGSVLDAADPLQALLEGLEGSDLPEGFGLEELLGQLLVMLGMAGIDAMGPFPAPPPAGEDVGPPLLEAAGATVEPEDGDMALAELAAEALTSLPGDWQRGDVYDGDLAECFARLADLSEVTVTGAAAVDLEWYDDASPGFSTQFAAARVAVLPDEQHATRLYGLLGVGPVYGECLSEAFEISADSDPAFRPAGFPAVGDESEAWRLQATFPELGLEFTADVVHFRAGRVWALLVLASTPGPFDRELAHGIAEAVAARATSRGGI